MYYTIFGSIVFERGADDVMQATVCRHIATTVREDGEWAHEEAELMMFKLGADSYLIPQLCKWRIVNATDHTLVIDDNVTVGSGETLNWHKMKSWEEHMNEMGEHYA